jgi:hypothetical protein
MIRNCYHFYKQNNEFTRNQDTFKNSYLFKIHLYKKCHVLRQL